MRSAPDMSARMSPTAADWLAVKEKGRAAMTGPLSLPVARTGVPATLRKRWRTKESDSCPARNSS
ncbi:hypothetical protein ABIA16_002498 [Sinorhizobium fredii]